MAKGARRATDTASLRRTRVAIPRSEGDTASSRRATKHVSAKRLSGDVPSAHRRGGAKDYVPSYKEWIEALGWRISGPEYDAIGIITGKRPSLISRARSQSKFGFKVSSREAKQVLLAFDRDRRDGSHSVPEETCDGVRLVSAVEFLAWAQYRGYPVPEWLPAACEARRTQFDLNGALLAVKNGYDPSAALGLIKHFYDRLRSSERLEEKVLYEYLEHAFGRIITCEYSADRAFGLARGPGERERDDTNVRDLCVAANVILLQRNGRQWLAAIGDVANIYFPDGQGEGAIKNAFRKYKEDLLPLPDQVLQLLCTLKSPDLRG